MADSSWVLAIDFGTTFTVAASRQNGRAAEIIEIDGERRVPSVVMITDTGGVVVGRAADEMAAALPSRVLRAPKSRLGDPAPIVLGGKAYQAASLVAEVLAKVYDEAVRYNGSTPVSVRLTYPASWGGQRRQQLVRAAELAGLPAPVLVPEPVAAAISYADSSDLVIGSHVLVYDLGGGTFDCAVLRAEPGGFVLVGRPGGDSQLGGELFDELLANTIGERLPADVWENLQLGEEPVWRQAWVGLRREARRAKELLSGQPTVDILVALPAGIREVRLQRSDLEAVVGPHIAESVQILRNTVIDAGFQPAEIDSILLVGGASRAPLVETLIAEFFPQTVISKRGDPKAVVALGATHPDAETAHEQFVPVGEHTTDPRSALLAVSEETVPATGPVRFGEAAVSVPTRVSAAPTGADQALRASPGRPSTAGRLGGDETGRHIRRPLVVAGIVLAVLLAGAIAVFALASGRDPARPAAAISVTTSPAAATTTATTAALAPSPTDTAPASSHPDTTTSSASSVDSSSTTSGSLPAIGALSLMRSRPELARFVDLLHVTGLDANVESAAVVTVFAPTTAAFDALGLDTLHLDPAGLTRLVQHHLVPATVDTARGGTYATVLTGDQVTITPATSAMPAAVDLVALPIPAIAARNGVVYEIDVVLVPASPGSTVTTTKPAPGCGFACPPNSAVNTTIAPQHTTATVAQPTTTTAIPVVPDNTVSTKVPVPSVATLQTVQARSKIIGLGFTFAALGPVEADCGTGVLRAVSSVPAAGTLADPATTIVKVTFGCFSQ